jgi:signal transduction histidine kinase
MFRLNATNLDESSPYRAPYREFEKLVDVFEGLRVRLNDGFIKARRFASDASHELRTPLTILRGQAELLIDETPVGSDMQIRARTMSDEVERLIDITEKLLLLSRADAKSLMQQLADVNFSKLVLKLMNDANSFQSSIKITCDIQPDITWRCDRTLVSQLIQNLYFNAVNYNLPGGWIHVSLKAIDGYLLLTMENPTADAPSDLGARAFDRFYRGDASHTRKVDGLGLGLSICSEIAQLHQGVLKLTESDRQTIVLSLKAPLQI